VSVFFVLLGKILPLYANIVLGYLASRYLRVNKEAIATVLFYVVGPMVVFSATLSVTINPAVLFLPVFFYLLGSLLAFIHLKLFEKTWPDATSNILGFTAGTGNSGYYGIALALVLFEPAIADIFIFTVLASFFYEATTGFYITAKGTFTALESFKKVCRLPTVYAFLAALVLNLTGIGLPESITAYAGQFKVVFSILGMMVIGMGLDGMRKGGGVDVTFLKISLTAKHLLWPTLVCLVILLDTTFTHLLYGELYKVMFVFSIVPMAGNTVTLAVLLNAKPEKAALAVLLSNLLSIVYVPVMLAIYAYVSGLF
jgi:predicted permease